jgi:hypothetical protein
VLELDTYCREHHLTGSESEHDVPYLPHRITVHTPLGERLAEAAGWTPEHAAIAMLRRLHAQGTRS